MAPDLNSVPPSPRPERSSRSSSRPTSQLLSPISPTLNILPSNQSAVNQITQSMAVPTGTGAGGVVDTGPGPLRHPRPLTAADLHMQLEKEQEAVVSGLFLRESIWSNMDIRSIVSLENCLYFELRRMLPLSPTLHLHQQAFQTVAITMQTTCSLVRVIHNHLLDVITDHLPLQAHAVLLQAP